MNVDRINTAIISGNLTNDELSTVIEAVRYARSRLGKQTIRSLTAGDSVGFTNKAGVYVTGSVVKVAIKYVTVRTSAGLWKVPASMLTVETEADNALEDFNSVGSRHHY
jgi:hypothetical protein